MATISFENIADIILSRREVYNLDLDTRIREAANRLTARALFELLSSVDDQAPDFLSSLSGLLEALPLDSASYQIGFDETGSEPAPEDPGPGTEYYLRLVFVNEDAAYYQFPLFPDLNARYVLSAARKRSGPVQHLRLELSRPQALQSFIETCRQNPHFVRVEESTADEFMRASSNSI